jgi:hypothetical protein
MVSGHLGAAVAIREDLTDQPVGAGGAGEVATVLIQQ